MKDEEILPIAMAVVGVVTYLFYVYRYCIKENLKLKKIFKWLSGISLIVSLCFF